MSTAIDQVPPLLRQCSGAERRECFCSDSVGSDPAHDVRLACRCLIHRACLVSYIRSLLSDRLSLFAAMENAGQIGIICPYARANQCNAIGKETFISLKDMENLITKQPQSDVDRLPSEVLIPDEVARFKRWIEEEKGSSSVTASGVVEANEEKRKMAAKVNKELEMTGVYITATTKACPSCQFRVTHWHGHSCHHIQPSGGCPKCKVPFCYKCLQSGSDNRRLRGSANKCLCGGWSNFCCTSDVPKNIVLSPYPYDKRCGCFICPDCLPSKPCGTCAGHCVVCLGLVPPGPRELNSSSSCGKTGGKEAARSPPPPPPVNPITELFAACQAADAIRIVQVLSMPNAPSVNVRDNLQRTPLFYVIDRDALDCVTLLLGAYAADASVSDSTRNTPLHHAAENGNVEIARLILQQPQVNVNAVNSQGATALHSAVAHNAVHLYYLLLQYNAATNVRDAHGRTPLHIACETGNEEIVTNLVQKCHENVLLADSQGKLPLHYAAAHNAFGITLQLVEAVQDMTVSSMSTSSSSSAAAAAAATAILPSDAEFQQRISKLLHVRDHVGYIPLHYAVLAAATQVVTYFLHQAPDTIFVTTGTKGKTMLMYAAEQGCIEVIGAILQARGKVPTRKRLATGIAGFLGYTAPVPTETEIEFMDAIGNEQTALYAALERQSFAAAKYLIRRGCCLHDAYAILADAVRRGDEEMVLLLLTERGVPLGMNEARKKYPSTLAFASDSRIVQANYSLLKAPHCGDMSVLHAAYLQPEVLSICLQHSKCRVHHPISNANLTGPSSGKSHTKDADKRHASSSSPFHRGDSPLQLVLKEIVKEPPAQTRRNSSFNPFSAFGRWLFGLEQPPPSHRASANHPHAQEYNTALEAYTTRRSAAMASLALMIQYRGKDVRLRDLRVDPHTTFYHYLCSHDVSADLWRICLRNEVNEHGFRMRDTTRDAHFALHLFASVCSQGRADLLTVLMEDFDVSADTIVDHRQNRTMLHHAAVHGQAAVVRVLLSSGANVRMTDTDGCQALHLATNAPTAKCLVEEGDADIHAVNNDGCTPLHLAAKEDKHVDVVEYYLDPTRGRRQFLSIQLLMQMVTRSLFVPVSTTRPRPPDDYHDYDGHFYTNADVYQRKDRAGRTAFDYARAHPSTSAVLRAFHKDVEMQRGKERTLVYITVVGGGVLVVLSMKVAVPGALRWMLWALYCAVRVMIDVGYSILSLLLAAMAAVLAFVLSIEVSKAHRLDKNVTVLVGIVGIAANVFLLMIRFFHGIHPILPSR